MVTKTQLRALRIIYTSAIESPAQFAHLMWPDAEAWQRPAKCGNHGVSKGGGMRMAGGAYLGKLRKAGYVAKGMTCFYLTPAGKALLAKAAAQGSGGHDCGLL